MPRSSRRPTGAIAEALRSRSHTEVLLVGIEKYKYLARLDGPSADIGFLEETLTARPVGLFDKKRVRVLPDLTCEEFRRLIIDYAAGRSAKGDVLILYFSGHGCVIGGNEFGYCFTDTKLNNDQQYPLPLSVVPFNEVIRTLELYDVYPLIIIDACYSGMAVNVAQTELSLKASAPHAVISSSSYTATSVSEPEGGPFTMTLIDVLKTGLSEDEGSLWPFITIKQLKEPLRAELATRGLPLYHMTIASGLPQIPIARNVKFKPRTERFTPQFKGIILLLWNDGDPKPMNPNDFREKLGTGATNNHSKLSLSPWDLLVDDKSNDLRTLTSRGRKFAGGELKIPKKILLNPETDEWEPAPESTLVRIEDISEPKWK